MLDAVNEASAVCLRGHNFGCTIHSQGSDSCHRQGVGQHEFAKNKACRPLRYHQVGEFHNKMPRCKIGGGGL